MADSDPMTSSSAARMKMRMCNILALSLIVMLLSLAGAEGLRCHQCYRIRDDNTCHRPQFCNVAEKYFCFVQRVSRDPIATDRNPATGVDGQFSVNPEGWCFTVTIDGQPSHPAYPLSNRGGYIRKIHRGCTSYCLQAVRLSDSYIKYTYCCRTDYCNKYHAWQFL